MTTDYTNGLEADFWDDDPDAETFTHKTLADAVESFVDQECGVAPMARTYGTYVLMPSLSQETKDRMQAFLECLRALSPRSFFAWRRQTVREPLIESIATDLAERTLEVGLDELLDPDALRSSDRLLKKRLESAFAAVLREQLVEGQWKPLHCEQVGQVTLTAVQMEAMMRQYNPHWFATGPYLEG